jgi:hypothetical protein
VVAPKGEGTIFYVVPDKKQLKPEKSKVSIKLFSPEVMPDAPTVQFVHVRLKKKMPLSEIVDEGLAAHYDPCALVKAFILFGIKPEELVKTFHQVCQADPEYTNLCTPCIILKCTVEAMRALKEIDISEMQYGILMKNLAPITGDINPGDLDAIGKLAATGLQGPIPNYPPTQQQINDAKLPQQTQQVYTALVNAGAPAGDLTSCMNAMGVTPTTMAYTPATTPPPPPNAPISGLGGGGGAAPTPLSNSQ